MEHVWAAYNQEAKEISYKRYMADVSRLIGENLAMLTHGDYVASRWMDDSPQKEEPEDGDAIALDIIKRAGLSFKEKQDGPV